MLGIGIAEIVWRTDDTSEWVDVGPGTKYTRKRTARWTPTLRLWHPQFLYFDWADFKWMLVCHEGVMPLPRPDEQPHSDGKWVIWAPHGYQYGWLRALLRPLSYKYLMRGWTMRDWARYSERHGQPMIGAIVPKEAEREVKDDFFDSVVNGGSDAVIMLEQGAGEMDEKFDLKLIEATARSFDSFNLQKQQLDTDIAVTVLGQNLTTEVKGGSRAAAEVQENVRIDKRRQDAALATCLREQVLHWDAIFNYGNPTLAPRAAFQVEPPEDEEQEGKKLKALGDGIQAVQTASDGMVDVRQIVEEAGIPTLSDDELAVKKAAQLEEDVARQQALAPPDAGAPSGGGGGPPAPTTKARAIALRAGEYSLPATVNHRRTFCGLPIAVENPAGSIRSWTDETGRHGQTTMAYDYGFIEGHMGADGDEVDVYLGPDENAKDVHVVHQKKKPDYTAFDEDKVFLGFADGAAAKEAFVAHRDDGDAAWGGMSVIPLDVFKRKLRARTGTGKIRASATARDDAREATVLALEALVARSGQAHALRATRAGKPSKYNRQPDRIEKNSIALATRALAVDVAGLLEEINACKTLEDLPARIIERYRGMDPKPLAAIVEKARILATLTGRLTAIKQL
jgi:phage gp29-like protein